MNTQYGDPFGQKAGKPAIKSEGAMGSVAGIASTLWMAIATYQATGSVTDAQAGALVSLLISGIVAFHGRWTAKRSITSIFK